MTAVRESDVEEAFTTAARRCGAMAMKLTSPGRAGVPDRVVLMPDGRVDFVELKAPGKRPRPLQVVTFQRFADLGHPVSVIDSVAAARAYFVGGGVR